MIGEVIGNHRIIGKLGQGGMGAVYAAEDQQLGRRVAIKVLKPSITRESREVERFRTEAKVQASLNHPNVVTLYAIEPYQDCHCMVMEYVVGKNLAEIVREGGAMPAHIVVSLAKQVLEGLSAAHRLGIVHRDLKPSNVMLTPEGVAKVMDFGIAKVAGSKSLTASGDLVGTVLYMSPEQIQGEAVDARSDIYSLGVILFELLTGRVPFKEDSDFSIMIHHVQTPPPPPTQFLPDIPGALEDIVLRCLQKKPADRFQRTEEILAQFEAYEEQERALGRSQLYSRKTLTAWLERTSEEAQQAGPVPAAGPEPQPAAVAAAPVPAPEPAAAPLPQAPVKQGGNSRGSLLVVAAALMVLVGALTAFYYWGRSYLPFGNTKGPGLAAAAISPPPAAVERDPGRPPAGMETAAQNPAVAPSSPSAPMPSASVPGAATGEDRSIQLTTPLPAISPSTGATAEAPSGSPARRSAPAAKVRSGTEPEPGNLSGRQNSPSTRTSEGAAARSWFVFMDLDQAGEKLALGLAQARVAEVLRESGEDVLSPGAVGSSLRASLDRGDLASVRRLGIGSVILGTAHGSLESQGAYGSDFYVARVRVNLEAVGMADGKVAATASGNAKSRGMANAEAALEEALLQASSEAARGLLRQVR